MLNQSFTAPNFLRLLRKQDIYDYHLGKTSKDYLSRLKDVENEIGAADFEFSSFKRFDMQHGVAYFPSCLRDDFALRKLNDNIKRTFNIRLVDRNRILPQVKSLLKEDCEYWLQKIDLKRFFESINTESVIENLREDPRLSYESKRILEKLFFSTQAVDWQGVPRGISLSSTISELYMQNFDNACRALDSCYFYTRYVDDIILLYHKDPKNAVDHLKELLPPGVVPNSDKCVSLHRPQKGKVTVSDKSNGIAYLGYDFAFQLNQPNKASELLVGIAPKKIKKIKTRIALSLFDYCRTSDFELLKARFRFLTSNFKITDDIGSGNLYAGIHFNYCMIDKGRLTDLHELDNFFQRAVFSIKGSLGKKLNSSLSREQKRELCRFSFARGHTEKIVRAFKPDDFLRIKSAWKHV